MGAFDSLARTVARKIPQSVFDAIERRAPGPTLLDMARAPAGPKLARPAQTLDSAIDPRAIMGGAGALAIPTGAATAQGLDAWAPWEEQLGRENAFEADANVRLAALRAIMRGYTAEEVESGGEQGFIGDAAIAETHAGVNPRELAQAMRLLESGPPR